MKVGIGSSIVNSVVVWLNLKLVPNNLNSKYLTARGEQLQLRSYKTMEILLTT